MGIEKSEEMEVSSEARWFLMTFSPMSLLYAPFSSIHQLLATFHNALQKQVFSVFVLAGNRFTPSVLKFKKNA
jgi:hypothetical protein